MITNELKNKIDSIWDMSRYYCRTPKHIVNMIVNLMQPTINDTICDPAMGSAEFLCAASQYVKEHYAVELMKTENKEKFSTSMLTGFDIDKTIFCIGALNKVLHGIEDPIYAI